MEKDNLSPFDATKKELDLDHFEKMIYKGLSKVYRSPKENTTVSTDNNIDFTSRIDLSKLSPREQIL